MASCFFKSIYSCYLQIDNLTNPPTKMFIEFLLFLTLLWILHIQKLRRLPQGPFSLPLLGTLDLYTSNKSIIEVFFQKKYWDRYKDFCTYFLGPSRFVISINNFQLAKELFNKDEFSGMLQF